MDKEKLKQIKYIKTEIAAIERQIDNLEPLVAIDKVNGSDSHFPYTARSFTIEGVDTEGCNRKALRLRNRLQKKKDELTDMLTETNNFIESIPDSLIRQIIILRYVECKSWTKVAMDVGNNNTADSVRMMVNRFLK